MTTKILRHPDGGTVEEGEGCIIYTGNAVNLVAMRTLASALRAYGKYKLRMSRHLTPTTMLKRATEVTGKKYKRGEYLRAAADVDVACDDYVGQLKDEEVEERCAVCDDDDSVSQDRFGNWRCHYCKLQDHIIRGEDR